MSEQLKGSVDKGEKAPSAESLKDQQEKLKNLLDSAEKASHEYEHSIENIRDKIEDEAVSGKESSAGDNGRDSQSQHVPIIDRKVKQQTYQKTLHHVQRQLPKAQRAFSKFVHRPVVEAVSEASAKTVARPSGLFGGGLCALIGSFALVWISRHYGFYYNPFVFIALVIAGFALGVLIEWLWHAQKKLKK
jgi:hypothetical protein